MNVSKRSGTANCPVVKALAAAGGKSVAIQASLSQVKDIRCLFSETLQHFGQLDILVNNAGTGVITPVSEVTFSSEIGIRLRLKL